MAKLPEQRDISNASPLDVKRFLVWKDSCGKTIVHNKEQDKSSDIEQQPPFGDRKISNIQPQNRGRGLQNQQEHHIILTKYEAVHPTAVSENNSSSGMLII